MANGSQDVSMYNVVVVVFIVVVVIVVVYQLVVSSTRYVSQRPHSMLYWCCQSQVSRF